MKTPPVKNVSVSEKAVDEECSQILWQCKWVQNKTQPDDCRCHLSWFQYQHKLMAQVYMRGLKIRQSDITFERHNVSHSAILPSPSPCDVIFEWPLMVRDWLHNNHRSQMMAEPLSVAAIVQILFSTTPVFVRLIMRHLTPTQRNVWWLRFMNPHR